MKGAVGAGDVVGRFEHTGWQVSTQAARAYLPSKPGVVGQRRRGMSATHVAAMVVAMGEEVGEVEEEVVLLSLSLS